MHAERLIARRRETINAQERQVNLAIDPGHAAWSDERCRIEQCAVRLPGFEHADDGPDIEAARFLGEGFRARTGNGFAMRPGFLLGIEAIAGQDAFREYDKARSLIRGHGEAMANGLE